MNYAFKIEWPLSQEELPSFAQHFNLKFEKGSDKEIKFIGTLANVRNALNAIYDNDDPEFLSGQIEEV